MIIQKQRPEKSVSVWQPLKELEEMGKRLDDFNGRPVLRATWRRLPSEEIIWAPAVDVIEKDDKFLIKVELPGVKEDNVDISILGDMLTISGEKRSDSEVKRKGYYYSESSYGSFSRSMTIPSVVDSDKIEASFDNGVMEITLPKIQEVKPKKIKIAEKKKAEKVTGKTEKLATARK